MRVLIADDHYLLRDALRRIFKHEPDFEVVGEASSGREALERCRALKPDIVLMDIQMPEMDGLQATRAIKHEYPEISILILTVHDDIGVLFEAIKAGAAGY